ncbi:RsiW-degrading membrane proteinase PrsW (M82 family) [Kitasatospora sp. MAA19]|uniref:PrsW family intramembrane metalloprotease n=1 Tax=Kitasatospora sp. MAA19 TaxID=3035090 RepID=UPI00247675A7|nr:PrsW family intramembrane metalloprotease [Kitasatospora sp. MAA19]MDH6711186.1 RsiW-degrading membrane proteinase PrsW (M82 family) [Kitasatospora sp. MAA19]
MGSPAGGGSRATVQAAADVPETVPRTGDTRTIPGPRRRRVHRLVPWPGATSPPPAVTAAPARPGRSVAVSSVTATAVLTLVGCGVLILHLVQRQTGTVGLLVGIGLAMVPLPFVLGALAWLNLTARVPLRHTVFCLGWGACAATTVAIVANNWTASYLTSHQGPLGELLGAGIATPMIEETAKATALLVLLLPLGQRLRCHGRRTGRPCAPLLRQLPAPRRPRTYARRPTGPHARDRLRLRPYLRPLPYLCPAPPSGGGPHRRSRPRTLTAGVVLGGMTACGFAFTENALYLGRAFTSDQRQRLDSIGLGDPPSLRDFDSTVQTFVLRALLSPFAHPLFTALTGIGLAVALTTGRRWLARLAAPTGLLLAMALHGTWNAAADLGTDGFLVVYGALMVPCFAALVCFAAWARTRSVRHTARRGRRAAERSAVVA